MTKCRALHLLGKCSTTELNPQPQHLVFYQAHLGLAVIGADTLRTAVVTAEVLHTLAFTQCKPTHGGRVR